MIRRQAIGILTAVGVSLLATGCGGATDSTPRTVDILITDGSVFTGDQESGLRRLDVGINGEKIVFVGDAAAANLTGRSKIDAAGLVVTAGFIDPHAHAEDDLRSDELNANLNYLTQGVTTVFSGNDGDGPADVGAAIDDMRQQQIGTNVAFFVGHGSVREAVMGGVDRAPTDDELQAMRELVENSMAAGALGLSSGLFYAPGSFAKTDEVIELARVAGEYGGVYDTHLRDESSYNIGLLGAVEEAIEIARQARLPLHLAHIKALGVDVWHQSADVVELVENARNSGVKVTADQYPWSASGTHMRNALLPRWVLEGDDDDYLKRLRDAEILSQIRSDITENLRRRGGAESLLVVKSPNTRFVGLNLAQIADQLQLGSVDAAVDVMLDGSTRIASFNMHQADIDRFMQLPWVMTSSDGTDGHPRKYASFPTKYWEYVRRRRILSLEEFLYRSSTLTAETFGLVDRGRIAEDYVADIVVLDLQQFQPQADFRTWNALSTGVIYAIIDGQLVIRDGEFTETYAGQVLTKQ